MAVWYDDMKEYIFNQAEEKAPNPEPEETSNEGNEDDYSEDEVEDSGGVEENDEDDTDI